MMPSPSSMVTRNLFSSDMRPNSEGACEAIPSFFYDASLLFRRDASLLFRRMAINQIDRSALAKGRPLLFRELQGLCTLCGNKERCFSALESSGPSGGWPDYCPLATTLVLLEER